MEPFSKVQMGVRGSSGCAAVDVSAHPSPQDEDVAIVKCLFDLRKDKNVMNGSGDHMER